MALTCRARTEIKCRFFGVDENGHERGSHFVLQNKGQVNTDTEEEMRFRYAFANILLNTSYDEMEEAFEELFEELFPE